MRPAKPSELRDPQDALRAYLDEMLHLATAVRPAEPASASPPPEAKAAAAPAGADSDGPVERCAPRPDAPAPAIEFAATIEAVPESGVAETPDAVEAPAEPASHVSLDSPAAHFQFPLQCLMFRVAGHRLALPLIELAGVIPAATRLTRLPRSPAEVLGLLQHRERTLRVVDSGALLGIAGEFDAQRGHLLLLAAGDWALSCDAPEQVVYLDRDAIQWRRADTGQLRYGTLRESLATLLDPGAICRRLERRLGA